MSIENLRLEVVKLAYRHDHTAAQIIEKAQQLMDYIAPPADVKQPEPLVADTEKSKDPEAPDKGNAKPTRK